MTKWQIFITYRGFGIEFSENNYVDGCEKLSWRKVYYELAQWVAQWSELSTT